MLSLEHLVSEEANLQRVDPRYALDALSRRDLTLPGRLVQRRQRLRANERRRHKLVLSGHLNLAGSDPQQRLTVHDEPRHSEDATRLGDVRLAPTKDGASPSTLSAPFPA